MRLSRGARWTVVLVVLVAGLAVGGLVAFRLAVSALQGQVERALGPGSEIAALTVGWTGVEVSGLRIKGPADWPAPDALRAERVVIVPSLRSFLSDEVRVDRVTVVRPYLSVLRTRDGRLRLLPSLLERPATPAPAGAPPAGSVRIDTIAIRAGVVELYDATVATPPLRIRLEQLEATARDVVAPALTGRSDVTLAGIVKGIQRDGRLAIAGWIEAATQDSALRTELRGVDLVPLQPYLSTSRPAQLTRGGLDLDLDSEVRARRLKAPGTVTLTDLEFAPPQGRTETFIGVPRAAVVTFLKGRGGRISVQFVLEGDLSNPRFSLNEAFATRMAASMAESLGVSLRGLTEGVGALGGKTIERSGEAAKELGRSLERLLGGARK
jgi:uncharacterized protein involved in outer membrane biogenesis